MTDDRASLPSLSDVRQEIDAIDQQIQALLNKRASLAMSVAEVKRAEAGEGNKVEFYRPEREAQILRKLAVDNAGPLASEHMQRIYKEIISASMSLEEVMCIAYLGPQGTYSEEATRKHFGRSVEGKAVASIGDIFNTVESGDARFGVVPVENSTEGAVSNTLDRLMDTPLRICGEVFLRIQHGLLSKSSDLAAIKAVHAHPQSLAQCRHWLDENLPHATRISESSNAAAAKLAVEQHDIAAIAGKAAAEHYELATLVSGIEDLKNNTTRFVILGDRDIPPSGVDATSLLISAPHKPGGLRALLKPLEDAGVSMTRIESRPGRTGLWEYVFFIDVKGHQKDDTLSHVLAQLKNEAVLMRVLGSYPSAL